MNRGILKGIFNFYEDIRVIDIINDTITKISYTEEGLIKNSVSSYSDFVNKLSTDIKESDYKKVVEASTLQNLENNPSGILVSYEKIDNSKYNTLYTLVDADKKIIFSFTNKVIVNNNDDNNTKLATVTDLVSEAILKIYNLFEANTSSNLNIDSVETYINTVFSNLTTSYKELKNSLTKKAINISSQFGKTIMIVDDDLVTRNMLKKIFSDDYNIIEATNGKEAIEVFDNNLNKNKYDKTDNIVGVFLDLSMPVVDGFAVLDYMTTNNLLSNIPVIIISGDYEKETRNKAYNYNIADMIEKPFDFQIVKHRINKFINLYRSSNSLNKVLGNQNNNTNNIVNNIVRAYEYDYEDNIKKLSGYMNIIAREYNNTYNSLDDNKINKLALAIKYYDLGIYEIPKKIFSKNSFTDDDKHMIMNRVSAGCDVLDVVLKDSDDTIYKDYCYEILKYCHEYTNGNGYPYGLKQEKIPLSAQLAAICIDYLNLSFKNDHDTCFNTIIKNASGKYSAEMIEVFKRAALLFKNI